MSSIAINIQPEFAVSKKDNVDVTSTGNSGAYRIDSGKEDFNRIIASNEITTVNFSEIVVSGFDRLFYAANLSELTAFAKRVKASGLSNEENAIDTTSYELKITSPDAVIFVFGNVFIKLADGSEIALASPVYRIHPDKKGFHCSIDDIHEYATNKWTSICKDALFNSGNVSTGGTGAQSKLFHGKAGGLSAFYLPAALGAVVLLAVVVIILMARPALATSAKATGDNLADVSGFAQGSGGADVVAGLSSAQSHSSTEDFVRLQQNMLKDLGVDVDTNKQSLGCFTEGNS